MIEKLKKICEILNDTGDFHAELGDFDHKGEFPIAKDSYLIRFDLHAEELDFLVLMGDWGLTWEPSTVYTTPCWCVVDSNDPETAAKQMMAIARAVDSGQLSKGSDGEDQGYAFLPSD